VNVPKARGDEDAAVDGGEALNVFALKAAGVDGCEGVKVFELTVDGCCAKVFALKAAGVDGCEEVNAPKAGGDEERSVD
jgi:hypothetical protein